LQGNSRHFRIVALGTESPADRDFSRELKFAFPGRLAPTIAGWLRGRCLPDGDHPANTVTSIYFDTVHLDALEEKVNSDYLKAKVRLRWYGDYADGAASGPAFLEVKRKAGGRRNKTRIIAWDDAAELVGIQLHDARLRRIDALLRGMGVTDTTPRFPVVTIRYRRLRLLEPSLRLRVSIDTDIEATHFNRTLVPDGTPARLPEGVVEVKGAIAELPGVLQQLTALGCRLASFSKYGICMLADERVS
jgi:hypothetical protein